jgi:hypothetical protein
MAKDDNFERKFNEGRRLPRRELFSTSTDPRRA